MEEKNLKNKVISGLFWSFGERFITQGASFALSIILARLLMPSEYGLVALIFLCLLIWPVYS